MGQFELGASGIAAAILRGAALASQRVHKLALAAKKADGEEKSATSSMATILHKDFEDAARAQVRDENNDRVFVAIAWLPLISTTNALICSPSNLRTYTFVQLLVTENEVSRIANSAYT